MARFSSVASFSPAGTVAAVGSTYSNPVTTAAATDGRAFVHATTVPVGAQLIVYVMSSHDGTRYADVKAFDAITAAGDYALPIEQQNLGKYTKLRYEVSGSAITLEANFEKKTGY